MVVETGNHFVGDIDDYAAIVPVDINIQAVSVLKSLPKDTRHGTYRVNAYVSFRGCHQWPEAVQRLRNGSVNCRLEDIALSRLCPVFLALFSYGFRISCATRWACEHVLHSGRGVLLQHYGIIAVSHWN